MSEYSQMLYNCKKWLFNLFPGVESIYAFNRTSRDRWIHSRAKMIPSGSRVIDVGAGSCPYKSFFSHCNYTAHDIGMLNDDQLQERRGYGELKIVSDITSIPVESGNFDVVLCTEVIEHVPEPITAVQEIGRILKPGGLLLLSAPLRSALHQMPYHYYGGFTPVWYSTFLKKAGFENIEITPICGIFNFFGEEGLRIAIALSPLSSAPIKLKILLFPLWILTLPWFAILSPLLFFILDRSGIDPGNTTGYRIEAKKKSSVK